MLKDDSDGRRLIGLLGATGVGVGAIVGGGVLALAGVAFAATGLYTLSLIRKGPGGGQAANLGKVISFGVLIAGGLWALLKHPPGSIKENLVPFFPAGSLGLLKAMGFTFIALQGFDLIAAGAGEIRNPSRNIPRAMFLSLAAALAILASAFTMSTVVLVVRDVASAGAAASLIFLISFALTHWTSILARRRAPSHLLSSDACFFSRS
ncbi:MAG: hypothetical protein ABIH26_00255 [Candidatus Eisenbacteria bacterium]